MIWKLKAKNSYGLPVFPGAQVNANSHSSMTFCLYNGGTHTGIF